MSLKDKIAIVTGGGQGIGRGIARRLLEEGMRVVLAERDAEAGMETESEFKKLGEILYIPADVSQEDDVARLMARVADRFGRLDALVNNAGVGTAMSTPVTELSLAEWNRVIGVNLTGAFLCAKHAAPLLRESRGTMVNIGSSRAIQSERHTEAYSASKGGIVALTHALAISLGPDVRVNCISPAWIDVQELQKKSARKEFKITEADHVQHPVGRVGKAADVAVLVAFLIGDDAGFITGANYVIDGGMTRKMIYVE